MMRTPWLVLLLALLVPATALAQTADDPAAPTLEAAGVSVPSDALPVDAPAVPVDVPDVPVEVPVEVPVDVPLPVDVPALPIVEDTGLVAVPAPAPEPAPKSRWANQQAVSGPEEAVATGAAVGFVAFQALGMEWLRTQLARPGLGRVARRLAGGLALLPLFSRIEKGDVLDNEVRARIHDLVHQDPGQSLEQVRERAGIAWGTAVHHVRRLEASGYLVSQRHGNRRLLFPANTPQGRHRAGLAALQDDTDRRMALLVYAKPGIAQHELCATLTMRNPAASKRLSRLEGAGLLRSVRDGRRKLYHPTEAMHETLGVLPTAEGLVQVQAPAAGLVLPPAPAAATA